MLYYGTERLLNYLKGDNKMDRKKVVRFIKNHKKEILISTAVAIGGIIAFSITRKKPEVKPLLIEVPSDNIWRELDSSVINLGTIVGMDTNEEWIDVVVNDIKVSDLGKFGEELLKVETVNPETEVSAMISLIK